MSAFRQKLLDRLVNFYPPFLGAGIRVVERSKDASYLRAEMPLRFWNRNYVGVHYGGSLYSLCDPWFMLLLMKQLGPEYLVWDKAATIRFISPGKGKVSAEFSVPQDVVQSIREQLESKRKVEPTFRTQVTGEDGQLIAEVEKVIYIRKKAAH